MEIFATCAIALFTAVLACATIMLARHTKALSEVTLTLVKIEERRDQRDHLQSRLNDLRRAVDAAETIQNIVPRRMASALTRSDISLEKEMQAIKTLHLFKRYIDDELANTCLYDLCNIFDDVRREKANYKPNIDTIVKDIEDVQTKILTFVKKWREELSGAG